MARNPVTANLLMLVLLLGGLFMTTKIQQEVFPAFDLDTISVRIAYPGATPEEVEQGVVLAVEEAVRSLEGIKEVRSTAAEGSATVSLELLSGADPQKLYQDVQQAVARITTLPAETERPQIAIDVHKHAVLDIQVFGDADEDALFRAAQRVREGLLQQPGITQVDFLGARAQEVHVEIPEAALRAHGLTLAGVAQSVRALAVDRAGGSLETRGGKILLRVNERRQWAREFATLPLVTGAGGVLLRLGDVASVREGFADSNRVATFDGKRAIGVGVSRVGDQTPLGVADTVRATLPSITAGLPPQIQVEIQNDRSRIYLERLSLLLKNGFMGLMLVLLFLSLFLEFKLAFWVTVGIPTSFLGALLFLPGMDVSINMISLFAFIIALGIVVDDAIIAGENIYEYRQRGMGFLEASIRGARDISVPIGFSILTNIIAFLPMLFIPGTFGKIWSVIPLVVSTVFLISWVEALFILPAHLAHVRDKRTTRWGEALHSRQQRFSLAFRHFVEDVYGPFLRRAVDHRYFTVTCAIALLAVVAAIPLGGHMGIILMPKVESDSADTTVTLPVGAPLAQAEAVRDRLLAALNKVIAENGGERLSSGVFALIDENKVSIRAYLRPPGERPISTAEVARLWRRATGVIPGTESSRYESDRGGPGGGASISVELSHNDVAMLDRASSVLAERLAQFSNVKDVDDGFTPGKKQFDFRLTAEARSLGLTASEIGSQIRAAFYGAEALRQQRGNDEVKVLVRLPEIERQHLSDVEQMLIRTPTGGDVPLAQIAMIEPGRAFTSINRRNGRRTVTVTADVEPIDETARVLAAVKDEVLPQLLRDYPGLAYSFEGRQASMRDAVNSFFVSVSLALVIIFALLAVPFRSYVQPAIVMTAIPFGAVGAILGHLLMGYNLSMISVMGMIALGGVVVNDALVMIDYANRRRAEGMSAFDAMIAAGVRRFRPILLTTVTTFGGLAPMIFETSRQARFMIPMAISLGYGIVFATAITLVLVPSLYVIVDDVQRLRERGADAES
ncbi:MAG: efflux RND transporter permease subunit [Gammaproteobacteria bacterium]|nr:efflux RND transporter permease subunit [Gammaproteobacteria bacterium]MBU1415482.1 efflux RND transporter permease subunit [Gammaproteobacteria bacterium]